MRHILCVTFCASHGILMKRHPFVAVNGGVTYLHGKEFPYKVDQLRNKFKWCVSVCKKACLTIKSATGNNNTVIAIIVIISFYTG